MVPYIFKEVYKLNVKHLLFDKYFAKVFKKSAYYRCVFFSFDKPLYKHLNELIKLILFLIRICITLKQLLVCFFKY